MNKNVFCRHHPTRIYLAIQKTEYITGTQDSSPFEFHRKWKYTSSSGVGANSIQFSHEYIQQQVQLALSRFLPPVVQPAATEPSTAAAAASGSQTAPSNPPTRQSSRATRQTSFFGQIGQLLNQDIDQASVHSDSTTVSYNPGPSGSEQQSRTEPVQAPTENTLFLKKIQLQFNGADLGKKSFCFLFYFPN